MINRVVIGGRLTKDPELRRTESGLAVASFTRAVETDFKDKDGTRGADFVDCVAWRGTAEFVSKWFSKGRMAIVDGKLQVRAFTDKDGNRRKRTEVLADSVYFGGDAKKSEGTGVENPGFQPASGPVSVDCDQDFAEVDADADGELPF